MDFSKIDIRKVFANLKDGVFFLDDQGIFYANDVASAILGLDTEEMLGKKVWEIVPMTTGNDEFTQVFVDAAMDQNTFREAVVEYTNISGKKSRLRVCISRMHTEDNERITVVLITDLTELFKTNAAFRRYTSAEIADYVLSSDERAELGGQSREITILMSDLRGFTAMSNRMTAEKLITVTNHYFDCMSNVIKRYHGTIIEFLGDGMFVIFGAPVENKDHARDAVACGIEMQNAMYEVNRWNAEHGYPELAMGIGINSGACVVGNIGSRDAMKYGCMGAEVNLAGRVESCTIGGQIMISEKTVAMIHDSLFFDDEQKLLPKGAEKEISVFSVAAMKGKYDLHIEKREIRLETVARPVKIRYFFVDSDKSVLQEEHQGEILMISDDYALIHATDPVTKSDNLMILTDDKLYAKVVENQGDGRYLLCFTSKPVNYKEWKDLIVR